MQLYILKLRSAGLFSNVNEVIQQIHMAKKGGYKFVIDWAESCYRQNDIDGDPWNYYFHDCFCVEEQKSAELELAPETPYDESNIIRPDNELLGRITTNRKYVSEIISKHIKIKKHVQDIIENFSSTHFTVPIIAVHIRGPARLDWVAHLRSSLKQKNGVPYESYFACVNKLLAKEPQAKIFICSDSQMVIDEVHRTYGERVISYNADRSEKGEMHIQYQTFFKSKFAPYKLGEDVLVEAELIARTNYFVHGSSNVVQYVICRSPDLPTTFAYGDAKEAPVTSRSLLVRAKQRAQKLKYQINSRLPWHNQQP